MLEDAVSAATGGALPRAQLDSEWAGVAAELGRALEEEAAAAAATAPLAQLRAAAGLFCGAAERLGFSARPVRDALAAARGRYLRLLSEESRGEVRRALREEAREPMRVGRAEEWERLVAAHGLAEHRMAAAACLDVRVRRPAAAGGEGLPATMVFSRAVPRLLQARERDRERDRETETERQRQRQRQREIWGLERERER